jgi:hypothetical protein
MATITSGEWRRIGDNGLGFGIKRYADPPVPRPAQVEIGLIYKISHRNVGKILRGVTWRHTRG